MRRNASGIGRDGRHLVQPLTRSKDATGPFSTCEQHPDGNRAAGTTAFGDLVESGPGEANDRPHTNRFGRVDEGIEERVVERK